MRIISGKFKARRFNPPHNITARPTTDFAKESLFNLLNNQIDFEDISVLDLFAGTGSISLECVSRGCKDVIAIEQASTQVNFIRKTCASLKVDNLHLLRTDVFQYLKSCKVKFDFIFADPPYDLAALPTLPDIIFEKELLYEDGVFVLEHPSKYDFSSHPHFYDHRVYGSVNFTFFRL